MIEEVFDTEEEALGAEFTISNNYKQPCSIGVEGKTLKIYNMPQGVFDAFKASPEWEFVKNFGLFVQVRNAMDNVEIEFEKNTQAEDRRQLILDTRDEIQLILDKVD